jgi:hypothetical protein
MSMRKLAALIVAAASVRAADVVAPTPPMGWNSWDAYGTTVREDEIKANAAFMANRLKSHGWQYVVVDIQWYEPNAQAHGYRAGAELAMDEYGRLIPAVNRFPSAADGRGFQPLANAVHALGLKFGIHIMRGIPRQAVRNNTPVLGTKVRAADIANPQSVCAWNTDMYGVDMTKPGAQEYYDSIVSMYADWGVDFIKADDEAAPAAHADEIASLHRAIAKTGRAIVLSLSPGPARVEDAKMLAENAQMWRVSNDLWDEWRAVRHAFDLLAGWTAFARPGAWPDGDMLPLGHIGIRAERGNDRKSRLTPDEQRTVITLWAIARSPLIFGGDLPTTDEPTIALLTNDEVLAADQKAVNSRRLFSRGDQIAWISDAPASGNYLAVFNVADNGPADIRVDWKDLGLPEPVGVRDLWSHTDLGASAKGRAFQIPPHSAGLYRLTPAR